MTIRPQNMFDLEAAVALCDLLNFIFLHSVQSHMTASRRALEAFLTRYPLCYGYWKKFTDLERRAGYNNKAEEVKQERVYNSVFLLPSPTPL